MHLNRITTLVTAGLIGSASVLAAAPAQAAQAPGNRSLAAVLAADGNRFDSDWGDFDVLDRAVRTVLKGKPGSPVAVLADGKVVATAFAPTDRAFRALVTDLSGSTPGSERGTFRAVAGVADVDALEAVLLYHVVPGATIGYRQAGRSDGATLKTALQGKRIRIRVAEQRVRLVDADRDDRNAAVIPALKNLNKGNKQIAHGINRVLRPVNL